MFIPFLGIVLCCLYIKNCFNCILTSCIFLQTRKLSLMFFLWFYLHFMHSIFYCIVIIFVWLLLFCLFMCGLFILLVYSESHEDFGGCYSCHSCCQGKWHTSKLFVLLFWYMHCCIFYLEILHDKFLVLLC